MALNEYHFITNWRVESTVEEISDVIGKGTDLVRWWPSVYLEVNELSVGDENGIGKVLDLYTKGWLPYTLRWKFTVTESNAPYGFKIKAMGDFDGEGIWTFKQAGRFVNIKYDWKIAANKPLLKYLSFIMKPLFSANHHWAMRMGEESLKLELERLHALNPAARAAVPPPPPATTSSAVPMLLVMGGISAALVGIIIILGKILHKNKKRAELLSAPENITTGY